MDRQNITKRAFAGVLAILTAMTAAVPAVTASAADISWGKYISDETPSEEQETETTEETEASVFADEDEVTDENAPEDATEVVYTFHFHKALASDDIPVRQKAAAYRMTRCCLQFHRKFVCLSSRFAS